MPLFPACVCVCLVDVDDIFLFSICWFVCSFSVCIQSYIYWLGFQRRDKRLRNMISFDCVRMHLNLSLSLSLSFCARYVRVCIPIFYNKLWHSHFVDNSYSLFVLKMDINSIFIYSFFSPHISRPSMAILHEYCKHFSPIYGRFVTNQQLQQQRRRRRQPAKTISKDNSLCVCSVQRMHACLIFISCFFYSLCFFK